MTEQNTSNNTQNMKLDMPFTWVKESEMQFYFSQSFRVKIKFAPIFEHACLLLRVITKLLDYKPPAIVRILLSYI
jgi:hypothetical protein